MQIRLLASFALLLALAGTSGCASRRPIRLDYEGRRKMTVGDLERVLEQPPSVAEKVHRARRLAEEVDTTLARREAARLYLEAARESGGVPSVLAFAAATLDDDDALCKAMLDTSAEPVAVARRVLHVIPGGLNPGWMACLRAAVLAGDREGLPENLPAFDHFAHPWVSDLGVALELEERTHLRGASLEVRLQASLNLVASLAGRYPLFAAKVWSRLAPDVRERLRADPPEPLHLWLALLAFGDRDDAERIHALVPGLGRPSWLELLEQRSPDDGPLDPLKLVNNLDKPESDAFVVLAARAARDRMPSIAWTILDARYRPARLGEGSACAYLPARCATLRESLREQDALVAAEAAATAGRAEDARARKVSTTIARLLASPAPMPFKVTPLPGARPESLEAPEGRRPRTSRFDRVAARSERIGDVEYRVEASREVDPAPSAGGYWLVERRAGGETRTYLGLRVNAPYVVSATSAIPMIADGVLRLEATIAELDEGRSHWMDHAARVQRWGGPVLLEARIEDLKRDRDGDGLTDLLEDRLLLDPDDPDTDGDGIPDGGDPMPNVPDAPMAIAAGGLEALVARKEEADLSRFTVGFRGDWQGVHPDHRVVVLTPDEYQQAATRFGHFLTLRPHVSWLDTDRGFYMWSNRELGAGVGLKREASGWKAETIISIDVN